MSLALINLEKARLPAARPTDAFARGLQLAFRRAAERMREITTDAELVHALEARNATAIVTDARWRAIDAQLTVDLDAVLRSQVERAGTEELRRVAREFSARKKDPEFSLRFDLRNPFLEDFVRRKGAELVTLISGQARQQIRDLIEEGFVEGVPVRTTARAIRNSIGLDDRLGRAVRTRATALAGSGLGEDVVERLVSRYAAQLLRYRSENIARTETVAASNQGTLDSWRQAERQELLPGGMQKRWIAALGSSRTCPICEELGQSEPVGIHEEFHSTVLEADFARPPSHPSCFPVGTLVSASDRVALTRRQFDGELIVLGFASGQKLAVTPNHPILTRAGWLPASETYKVGHVVGGPGLHSLLQNQNDHEVPTRIEDEARARLMAGGMSSIKVPVAAPHFHGDGRGGDVEIVRAHGGLTGRFDAAFAKQLGQSEFQGRHVGLIALASQGSLAEFIECAMAAARGVVRRLGLSVALCRRHARPLEQFGLGSAARIDPGLEESPSDGRAPDADTVGDGLLAFAGQVALDQVVRIDAQSFHGQVLNLETRRGWYIANGVAVHNCRCTIGLVRP